MLNQQRFGNVQFLGLTLFRSKKCSFFSNISHISSFKCICHCKTSGGELCKFTGIWHVQIWMFRERTFFSTKNRWICLKIGDFLRRCLILNKAKCGHPMLHLGRSQYLLSLEHRLARARILDGFYRIPTNFPRNWCCPDSRQEIGQDKNFNGFNSCQVNTVWKKRHSKFWRILWIFNPVKIHRLVPKLVSQKEGLGYQSKSV